MQTRAKRALIVAFDELDLLDLAAPITALTRAGRRWNFRPFHVEIAAVTPGAIQSRDQLRFDAPLVLSAVASAEIVIVPGGYGARRASVEPAVKVALGRLEVGRGAWRGRE